jgi:predicted phosphate transport protein (TIGR00153 family)
MFAEAAANIQEAAQLLVQMLESGKEAERFGRQIKELEHKGDKLTHEIINKLNTTFVTPFDREDIYALCRALDDVIDLVDSAADRVYLFELTNRGEDAVKLAKIIAEASAEIVRGVSLLRHPAQMCVHCIEINRLENEGDRVFRHGLAKLFHNYADPIEIIKLKDFYQDLELATDRCEDVANVLEAISVKNV